MTYSLIHWGFPVTTIGLLTKGAIGVRLTVAQEWIVGKHRSQLGGTQNDKWAGGGQAVVSGQLLWSRQNQACRKRGWRIRFCWVLMPAVSAWYIQTHLPLRWNILLHRYYLKTALLHTDQLLSLPYGTHGTLGLPLLLPFSYNKKGLRKPHSLSSFKCLVLLFCYSFLLIHFTSL